MLETIGLQLPAAIAGGDEGMFNLPAVLIVLLLTLVLVLGIKISARVNAIVVAIKVLVVLFVIAAGLFFVRAANYSPFIPPAQETEAATGGEATLVEAIFGQAPANFGISGIFAAGALVFFAYIGFDIVATTAEEAKNPQRDVPRGPRLAGDLHEPVCGGLAGRGGHAELHRARHRGPAGGGLPVRWAPDLRQLHHARRARRSHHGDDDPDARPEPGGLRHEP
jgi:hypothetical protein